MRALVVLLLVAPAAFAQILGDESGIMGGEAGFFRPTSARSVRIDAMPFARTVTCSDYTLTGTAPGAGAVTWAASPSGDSGSCTGTTSWSCVVNVDPNAVGEGVEVITVTQGTFTDTETIGFYVDGEHSCFLAQSYDGNYNAGKADLDAVATWVNLGSSALNVTQATGSAQPTYRTSIVGGQPVVRCDGGDRLAAATAADWTFLHNTAVSSTLETVWRVGLANPTIRSVVASTKTACTSGAVGDRGVCHYAEDVSINEAFTSGVTSATAVFNSTAAFATPSLWFNLSSTTLDATNSILRVNGAAGISSASPASSALAPAGALTLCAESDAGQPLTGDLFDVLAYSSVLTSTQQGINEAVREWALGGTLPLVADAGGPNGAPDPNRWVFVGDSITEGCCGASSWPSKISEPAGVTLVNVAVSGATVTTILAQFRANAVGVGQVAGKVFILGGINNIRTSVSATTSYDLYRQITDEAAGQGSEVIVITMLPFGNDAVWTAPKQTELEALNVLIAGSRGIAAAVDTYAAMGEPGTPIDLAAIYDSGDGLHPNDTGTAKIADLVDTALGL